MPKKIFKVSPSGIGTLLECPRCLWLHYNEDIIRPRGIFPSLPNGMDLVLKDYFDSYRQKGELPPEVAGKLGRAKLYNEDLEKFHVWREINFGRGGLVAEFPELNIVLNGAIDELLVGEDGKYIPFDFKTRGFPTKEDTHEHYRPQLDLYTLLFEANGLPPANFGYLLFFWPKNYGEGAASFETKLIKLDLDPQRGRQYLERASDIIIGPKPQAHEKCEYCLYGVSIAGLGLTG